MKKYTGIIRVLVITTILFAGLFLLLNLSSSSSKEEIVLNSEVKAVIEKSSHNWGEIGINDGKVAAEFEILNEGSETLKLFNLETSCTCTTVQIISGDDLSPAFGMHTKSGYMKEVAPGESVTVKAIYDPAFHGPSGIGPISRQVMMETNDSANPKLTFRVSANVIK